MSLLDTASLIVTPNAYAESKLYSVIPSDGSGDLSVVRATTATRVNSAGLVELVPYNLLQYSEQFDNGAWIKITTTLTSGQSDPFGGNNAYKWNSSAIGVTQLSQSFSTGADVCNISIYAKAGSTSILNIWIGSAVTFDLANGSVTSGTGTITSVGNGWYRCSTNRSSISLTNTLNPYFSAASTSDFIYIYGGQAVEGSTAKDYQKTETRLNIPRLDYSNGTCPSLLVEPQRTNTCLYSEDLSNAAWTKLRLNVTANAITAPNGIATADKLIATAVSGDHSAFQITTSGVAKSLSVYAKAGEYNYVFLGDDNFDNRGAFFNLSNGTISQNTSPYTAKIEDAGNGWYRCSISASNWVNVPALIGLSQNGTTLTFTGNGTNGIYVWGAQIEAGSYATSYIPTTSASVTRNADVISKTGISSLIGQTEGTLFVDFDFDGSGYGLTSDFFLYVGDGANTDAIYIDYYNNIFRWVVFNGSTLVFYTDLATTNGRHKLALGYKAGQYVAYADGNLILADTNATAPPTCAMLSLAQNVTGFGSIAKEINAAALWQTRLTNTQLAQLTTI
jgi:hypothetical protein